jgi:hypothetical protein
MPQTFPSISCLENYIRRKLVICKDLVTKWIQWAGNVARNGWREGTQMSVWPGSTLTIRV